MQASTKAEIGHRIHELHDELSQMQVLEFQFSLVQKMIEIVTIMRDIIDATPKEE